MLDSDLAELYGVETKVLNQAVTRNSRRFPERFCFRIMREEAESLRSQIVTLDPELGKQNTWWRYMPRVFTEQGVSMLSDVLRSDTAIDVSVRIMDAFVEMRHFIADNAHMFEQIRSIDRSSSWSLSCRERSARSSCLTATWTREPSTSSPRSSRVSPSLCGRIPRPASPHVMWQHSMLSTRCSRSGTRPRSMTASSSWTVSRATWWGRR